MERDGGLALVFGASGTVGRALVPRLRADGWRVRAAARRLDPLKAEGWTDVELVRVDALEPDGLASALEGVAVAYYLVHSMAAGADFPERDRTAARNFAEAAARAGVQRIVYLGGLAPERPQSAHLASRIETGEVLRGHAVPVTELRAPVAIGPGSAAFEVMRDLAAVLPVMITPRWVRSESPPIALDDLVEDLAALARAPGAAGRIYETGGPERLSYEAMLRRLAVQLGRPEPLILPVPLLTPELSSTWLALVSATPASVARALIGGMAHDLAADDRPLRALVPRPTTGFADAVQRTFERERRIIATDRWRDGAFNLRGHRHDVGFYAKRMSRSAIARAPAQAVWDELSRIGSVGTGYFAFNPLWDIQRELNALFGARPADLRPRGLAPRDGDRFDMWEVLAARPPRRLTLVARMAAPGSGGLEFEIADRPAGGTRLTAAIHWHPAGAPGLAYWYKLSPIHAALLRGMVDRITRRAEARLGRRAGARLRPAPA